jgi:class 3 adenylate cyclase/tetratricopeptide (TPR) repeat protein
MDTSVPQGTGNTGILFCPSCGQQNPQSNRFCGQCGKPLPSTCPSCGAANPAGNRFCSTCGSEISAPASSSFPQPTIASGPAGSTPVERERRLVTVLFCDLVGFTPLSERLDPEDVREIQTLYFGKMSQEIRTFGGTVEKYIGDAVLAMFGVPVAHEDDAVRAIRCGLGMQAALTSLAADVARQWGVELALRVGVNTGEVVTGKWEVAGRKEYDVSGDAVNTAARLQTAAVPGEVLVGEETMWLARKAIRFGERREVILKGKAGVVPVYAALEFMEEPTKRGERGSRTTLVGRNDELALLKSMWAKVVREERPHFVTVLGEPGIGKSRLVAEFEGSVLNEALMLHGRCLPYGEVLGYWALAEILKEATGITATDDRETTYRKLGDLVAKVIGQTEAMWDPGEITRHLALLTGLDIDMKQSVALADQRALHVSVRRFIEALAHSQPLIVLLEDLHWADDALLDLIEFMAAHGHDVPLLIVVQARPELLEKRPAWGRGVRGFTSLSLEPLDEGNGHELVLQLCKEHGLSEEVMQRIGHGAAGNPLFAEELVATIAERGGTMGVPSAIKALISARLDVLAPEERRAIQLAAVIGKVFWEGGLRALGASDDVNTHLEVLEQKDLLRSQPRSQFHGDQEYAFKHDLIRDVAYEMLSRADRRLLHSRVVTWVEVRSGERIEEYLDLLAHHAVRAEQPERALDYLTRAAERAERAAAHREEAALLAQAIEIAERAGQKQLVAELRAKRGKAFSTVTMWREASPELELALAGLASEQVERRIQVLIDLANSCVGLIDIPSARRYATEALALAEEIGRDGLAAGAMCALAYTDCSDGAIRVSLDQYQRAFVRATEDHIASLASGVEMSGLILYWLGNFDDAITHTRRALELARKSNDIATIASALGSLCLALTGKGCYGEALQVFAEARQFTREYGTGERLARATSMCGGLHLEVFDFARAEALAEEAREISRSLNWPLATASAGIDLLLNFARRGEVGRCEPLLPEVAEAVVKAQGVHGWNWRLRLAEARAEIALARGEWEEAMRWVDDAIAQSVLRGRVKYQAAGLETRAKALVALGRKHEAIASLRSAVELARPVGDPAMFLHAAVSLLVLDGNDQLLAETRTMARRIIAALPDEEMIRRFKAAESVRVLGPLTP